MPFNPEQQFPDLSRLRVSLNNSKISIQNNALYQTIEGLINKVEQLKDLTVVDLSELQVAIDNLTSIVNNISIGSIVSGDKAWMPVFDGEDGAEPFLIPGPQGPPGRDGKDLFFVPEPVDYCEPPYLGPYCCGDEEASVFELTTTGNIDDLDFANASVIRADNATLSTIRGLKAGKHGQAVTIISVGAGQVDLAHQAGGSAAANRLTNFATSANTSLAAGVGAATYRYDATDTTWRLTEHQQGAWIEAAFNAGDFTGSGGMGVTVAAGDRTNQGYILNGRTLTVNFEFTTVALTAPAGTTIIQSPIPGGFTAARQTQQPNPITDNGAVTAETGKTFVTAGGTSLNTRRASNVNWTVGADAGWSGVLNLEVT